MTIIYCFFFTNCFATGSLWYGQARTDGRTGGNVEKETQKITFISRRQPCKAIKLGTKCSQGHSNQIVWWHDSINKIIKTTGKLLQASQNDFDGYTLQLILRFVSAREGICFKSDHHSRPSPRAATWDLLPGSARELRFWSITIFASCLSQNFSM